MIIYHLLLREVFNNCKNDLCHLMNGPHVSNMNRKRVLSSETPAEKPFHAKKKNSRPPTFVTEASKSETQSVKRIKVGGLVSLLCRTFLYAPFLTSYIYAPFFTFLLLRSFCCAPFFTLLFQTYFFTLLSLRSFLYAPFFTLLSLRTFRDAFFFTLLSLHSSLYAPFFTLLSLRSSLCAPFMTLFSLHSSL
jgi:hypothetical protein